MISYLELENIQQKTLRGMVHQCDETDRSPIIIVHGFFSSNKIGPYRLYYLISERLRKAGNIIYRVDLSAMGESDGVSQDITFIDHVDDLASIVDWVIQQTEAQKVHLLSHCFGCCTALTYAKNNPKRIRSLTFMSPFIPSESSFLKLLGRSEWSCYNKKNPIYHRGMYCDRSFIENGYVLEQEEYISILNHLDFKAYIPQNDEFCDANNIVKWALMHSLDYYIIPQGDHNYLNSVGRNNLFDAMQKRYDSFK